MLTGACTYWDSRNNWQPRSLRLTSVPHKHNRCTRPCCRGTWSWQSNCLQEDYNRRCNALLNQFDASKPCAIGTTLEARFVPPSYCVSDDCTFSSTSEWFAFLLLLPGQNERIAQKQENSSNPDAWVNSLMDLDGETSAFQEFSYFDPQHWEGKSGRPFDGSICVAYLQAAQHGRRKLSKYWFQSKYESNTIEISLVFKLNQRANTPVGEKMWKARKETTDQSFLWISVLFR